MSNADRKAKRKQNDKAYKVKVKMKKELDTIKEGIIEAKEMVIHTIDGHRGMLLTTEEYNVGIHIDMMLSKKSEILTKMEEAAIEVESSCLDNFVKLSSITDEEDRMELIVEIGEGIGNLNMLNSESTNVMEEVYNLAKGEDNA